MARSRNIKPSFFFNEDLVELDFKYRLLFIGMWTLADREGRIENRPKKIKMNLFPADEIDIKEGLEQLEKYGFIEMYSVNGIDVIDIINFSKHQTPHGLEKDSELPDKNGFYTVYKRTKSKTITGKPLLVDKKAQSTDTNNSYETVIELLSNGNDEIQENSEENKEPLKDTSPKGCSDKQLDNSYETVIAPVRNALIPDSLNPDSLIPEPCNKNNNNNNADENFESVKSWEPEFDEIKKIMLTENPNMPPLTENLFSRSLRKFKAHHIELEKNGEFIKSDEKRIDLLVGWLTQAQVYELKAKQDTVNAATGKVDNTDWSQVGRKPKESDRDVSTGYHPSHKTVTTNEAVEPPQDYICFVPPQHGGTKYPLFEGMSMPETYAHTLENKLPSETAEEAYLRLARDMGVGV